jgi:hypothetical protein
MTSFNDSVIEYKKQLDKGDIQIAYRGLIEYMLGLKNFFKNKYPDFSVPSSLYQGYMDMTYFALFPEDLKKRKLKIAIVLIHDKMKFEIWLSGINKQIQIKYWNILKAKYLNVYHLPETLKGADSIIEYFLTDNPDFNAPEALTRQIEYGTLKFIKDIKELIKDT